MRNSWSSEIWRLTGLLLLGLLVGFIVGQPAWILLVVTILYLAWHLRNLYRLDQWLQGKRRGIPETTDGAWANVYYHLYRMQQRNRRRKKRLATMVNRFRESTNALPDAAVVLGAAGNIENWNKTAESLLRLKNPQDMHQPITNLIRHPGFIKYLNQEDFSKVLRLQSTYDENVFLSLQIVPYGNKQHLLMVRNITHLHRLEQMRQDFIANVSHELRTPLTVIAGYLETMLDDDDDWVVNNSDSMKSMLQQAQRMQNIVSDLLLLSRLETEEKSQQRQEVDVPAILEMIISDAKVLSQGKHEINLEYDRDLYLHANREEITSAFSNLIYNAVKYTPDGGEINVRWYEDNDGVHFRIQDDGPGIASQHLPRLTERFYRIDAGRSRASGGTGLGLAIVKHVLNRHEASLKITSKLGTGSTFICTFLPGLAIRREIA
ncbi:MAG: phosphate regulon sensor histidine kinase PhoR [Gammaproteobacteria bacterium]|nr:phosphate regulon sensor histidine kinase PhoR [Gammaproteobacteria bacterium]